MVLLFSVINFASAFKSVIFSSKMPSFNLRLINVSPIYIKWIQNVVKIIFKTFMFIFVWTSLNIMASNKCPNKSIKYLATKTRFDNFSYQVLFWYNFSLIRHQKFLKNAKLKRLTKRQCVITLPMTFNSTWKLKFEIENLTKTVKMKMTRTISISSRMNQTIQEFSSWESHMKKRMKMC